MTRCEYQFSGRFGSRIQTHTWTTTMRNLAIRCNKWISCYVGHSCWNAWLFHHVSSLGSSKFNNSESDLSGRPSDHPAVKAICKTSFLFSSCFHCFCLLGTFRAFLSNHTLQSHRSLYFGQYRLGEKCAKEKQTG